MARQSTANINLTYEIDKNNNFSYDDDIKNNLIAIDQAIGEDRTRLDNLDNPQSAPLTIESNIHSISNSSKGQVSATLKGRTVTNILDDTIAGCEATTGWNASNVTIESDSSNKFEGTNCLKVTLNASKTAGSAYRDILSLLDTTKYYFISVYEKNSSLSTGTQLRMNLVGDAGFIDAATINSSSYLRQGIVIQPSDFDTASEARIHLQVYGAETEYGFFDALMVNEISASEYTEGADVLLQKYNWHLGVKSTLCALRLKSNENNLLPNESMLYGNYDTSSPPQLAGSDGYRAIKPFSLKTGTYTISTKQTDVYINLKNELGETLLATSQIPPDGIQVTIPSDSIIYGFIRQNGITWTYGDYTHDIELQIELGNSKTTYIKYDESISYYYVEDESGNTIEMNSVGSIYDEVRDGKLYKRTEKSSTFKSATGWTVDAELTNTIRFHKPLSELSMDDAKADESFTLVIDGVVFPINIDTGSTDDEIAYINSTNLLVRINKSKLSTLNSAGVEGYLNGVASTLIYQLVQENITENGENGFSITGSLASYDGETTIIAEPYLKKSYTIYSGTITLDYPIESIDKLLVLQGGIFVDATGTLSSDGKTITVSGAGTYQVEGVIKSEEHAGQQLVVTYPLNTAGSIQSIGDLANDNASLISDHEWKLLYISDDFIALELSLSQQGATSARPTNANAGDMYFDTDLGKPIWYNGTNWIDATATIV